MKQRLNVKTLSASVLLFSLLLNLSAPAIAAVLVGPAPIKIAYFPNKVGKYGSRITFRVHVADDVDLQRVTLVILDGDKPTRGKMTELTEEGPVPVLVRTLSTTPLYTAPRVASKSKTELPAGESLDVSQVSDSFLRIVSPSGKKGYVLADNVEIISIGRAFTVTLPPSMTQRTKLTYRFEANGDNGAVGATETVTMRLLTGDEIQKLVDQYRASGKLPKAKEQSNFAQKTGPTKKASAKMSKPALKAPTKSAAAGSTTPGRTAAVRQKSGPLIGKPVFWGGVAAAGAVAWAMLKDRIEQENLATLNVVVDWQ